MLLCVQGVDFYFSKRSHGQRFLDFLQGVVPMRYRTDKQLVSHNEQNATYNYKYTFSVEIVPICKVLISGSSNCCITCNALHDYSAAVCNAFESASCQSASLHQNLPAWIAASLCVMVAASAVAGAASHALTNDVVALSWYATASNA